MSTFEFEGKVYDAEKLHTKQLLRLLREVQQSSIAEYDCAADWEEQKRLSSVLKAELEKREHVPNKQEAKEIRKQKALKRKNQKNKKYRNR